MCIGAKANLNLKLPNRNKTNSPYYQYLEIIVKCPQELGNTGIKLSLNVQM